MANLAIKGHPTRGKEIIEILEMLGGKNKFEDISFITPYIFLYVDDDYYTEIGWEFIGDDNNYEEFVIYTLEEFLEKCPYKVGDKVILDEIPCTITWMCWECNNIYYQVQGIGDAFTKKVTADELNPYKEKTMEDKDMSEHISEINLNHPCFDGCDKIELIIPENWKFEQRGNKMFGIRKYPQYPKTYKECCDILRIETNRTIEHDNCLGCLGYRNITLYDINLLTQLRYFRKLLICRDAYWKIAGEQMGLDKPWEYNMSKNEFSCAISYEYGSIQKCEVRYRNHFLVFPTKEIRDEFYNNFKELINEVKELL